jgi:hypothetical protein
MSLISSMTRLALGRWMLKGCMRSFMRATIGTSNAIQYIFVLAYSSPRQITTSHGSRC